MTRFGEFFTAARINRALNVTFVILTVVVVIYETVMYFEKVAEQERQQEKLYEQENIFEQKFQALLLDLNATQIYKRKWFPEHYKQGLFNYTTELPKPTEIKSLWRYGELGIDYLNFRLRTPTQYPSIAEGLDKIEELFVLISPGYLRILPYLHMGDVVNQWGNWSDALQYGYIPYAEAKKKRNWEEFSKKYQDFLMQHGNNQDLSKNYFDNSPNVYWANQMKVEQKGSIGDFAALTVSNLERLVPLLTSFIAFEDSLSDHTGEHTFISKTRILPQNIAKTWSVGSKDVAPVPRPQLPKLNLLYTAQAKFGNVSAGATRDPNVAYGIPKLSCILLGNYVNCYVLTSGNETTINNVTCNVIPMGYTFIDDTHVTF